jgi:hypothetical protein
MLPLQHAAVEAVYADMAWQLDYPKGSGEMLDAFGWHQVMVGSYAYWKGWKPKFLPTTEGDGMVPVMRTKQSRLTRDQGSELIEFVKSYAVDRGAELREWDDAGNLISGKDPARRAA